MKVDISFSLPKKLRVNHGARHNWVVRRNDEGEAQSRRWTFYEAINIRILDCPNEPFEKETLGTTPFSSIHHPQLGCFNTPCAARP